MQGQITMDICREVLSKTSEDFHIINFTTKPFSEEIKGYLGNYSLLEINVESRGQVQTLHFFLKIIRLKNPIMLKSQEIVDLFSKETHFYEVFLKEVKTYVPNFNPSFLPEYFYGKEGILILEDLTLGGFQEAKSKNFDEDHVKICLRSLAKLHAASLALEEAKTKLLKSRDPRWENGGWRIPQEFDLMAKEPFWRLEPEYWGNITGVKSVEGLKILNGLIPETLPNEEFKSLLGEFMEFFWATFNEPNNFRKVVSHGDLWVNNVLFKYEGGNPVDCKMVDFQIQRYSPPAHDVTFCIFHTTSRSTQQMFYSGFLRYYYETLGEELAVLGVEIGKVLPYMEYLLTCNVYGPIAKLIRAIYATVNAVSQDFQAAHIKDEESFFNYLLVERNTLLLEFFQNDGAFREKMIALLEDVKDALICWKKSRMI